MLLQIEQKSEEILKDEEQIGEEMEQVMRKMEVIDVCEEEERELFRQYTRMVTDVVELKYAGERPNYPDITFLDFKAILEIWNAKESQGRGRTVPGCNHLTYSHLRLLAEERWLNDEIISEYIAQLNGLLFLRPNNPYLIFDSLKVTSLFERADAAKMDKVL